MGGIRFGWGRWQKRKAQMNRRNGATAMAQLFVAVGGYGRTNHNRNRR